MKLQECFKGQRIQKRCEIAIGLVILVIIFAGSVMAISGCKTRRTDFSQNYYFCEEVGDKRTYYGGLMLIFVGVMSLFGWIFSIIAVSHHKRQEEFFREAPANEYNTIDDEPFEVDEHIQIDEETKDNKSISSQHHLI
mmetsp:Transcript_1629/g.1741  ORF Transcript_1629/g.1741 Transcript_1629/m.1741 type:complete len:138 (+) Transcript_1629:25-438(+)